MQKQFGRRPSIEGCVVEEHGRKFSSPVTFWEYCLKLTHFMEAVLKFHREMRMLEMCVLCFCSNWFNIQRRQNVYLVRAGSIRRMSHRRCPCALKMPSTSRSCSFGWRSPDSNAPCSHKLLARNMSWVLECQTPGRLDIEILRGDWDLRFLARRRAASRGSFCRYQQKVWHEPTKRITCGVFAGGRRNGSGSDSQQCCLGWMRCRWRDPIALGCICGPKWNSATFACCQCFS